MGEFDVDAHIRRIRENPFRVVLDGKTGAHVAVPVVTHGEPVERDSMDMPNDSGVPKDEPEVNASGDARESVDLLLPEDWAEIYADVLRLEDLYHLDNPQYRFRFGPPCNGCAAHGEQFLQGVYVERAKRKECGLCGARLGRGYSAPIQGTLSKLVWPGVDVRRLALSNQPVVEDETIELRWQALRKMRLQIAREEILPPYIIFHDTTLREVARLAPQTDRELLSIQGIGPTKLERYGDKVLETLAPLP